MGNMKLLRTLAFATALALSLFATALVASADPGRTGPIETLIGAASEVGSPGDPGGGP